LGERTKNFRKDYYLSKVCYKAKLSETISLTYDRIWQADFLANYSETIMVYFKGAENMG
jgi:hypothetical protein